MAIYMWREPAPVSFTSTFTRTGSKSNNTYSLPASASINVTLLKDVDILGLSIAFSDSTVANYIKIYSGSTTLLEQNINSNSVTFDTPVSLINGNSYTILMRNTNGSSALAYNNSTNATVGIQDLSEYLTINSIIFGDKTTQFVVSANGY